MTLTVCPSSLNENVSPLVSSVTVCSDHSGTSVVVSSGVVSCVVSSSLVSSSLLSSSVLSSALLSIVLSGVLSEAVSDEEVGVILSVGICTDVSGVLSDALSVGTCADVSRMLSVETGVESGILSDGAVPSVDMCSTVVFSDSIAASFCVSSG